MRQLRVYARESECTLVKLIGDLTQQAIDAITRRRKDMAIGNAIQCDA